ncbi:hypothetical protein DERP_005296 [Dermatophagoides pteronyssinus]|uniref:Uncharacterized protein n=1 Tax=Dermatophagoides pteronyssinus TaxID=6956 RepID=A0ABQ8JMZ0_DERPT|nr:hypothetical protein DERP_005296 [Dermatophagoides pteronyssinus]
MAKLSGAAVSSSPPPPQNLMTIAKTMISSRPPPPPTTTTTSKSNLMDQTKKLSSSILSSTSTTTTTTTQLTPSPSLFRHFFYILNIYRYVLFCLLFGCMSLIIGVALFLLGILFRTNTTSIHLLESVPLYMPSLILFCNGLSLMAFMNKNTRRMYLLKSVCGLYLLVLLLMIIIAITTSAIHLPRFNSHPSSKHFIMEEIMNCDIVHGIIYDSLRVVFALSLLAIIISLFSMITLFKLSTHEKRKLYFQNQLAIARNHHRHQYQSQIQSQSINYQRSLANYDQCPATSTTTAVTTKHQTSTNQFNHPSSSFPSTTNFKCLSADFSSQDLLIDNPNHHHQTFKSTTVSNTPANDYPDEMLLFSPNRKLERKDKIWSSSQSTTNFQTISDNKQYRSSDINNNNHQQSTSNLRRYMSVILDTPSNVQSYVWRKLNSLKNIQKQDNSIHHDDDADDSTFSHHHHHHHRRKHPLLPPPHMAIPRFSVSQLSNMNANNSINSKSILKTSSSSSTYSNESSSNLGSNSSFNKSQTIRYQLNTANNNVELLLLPNQQTNLIFSKNSSNDDIESGHQFETNVILFNNVEQSRTDFTSKYCQQSLQSVDNSIHSSNESTENHSKWSKYLNDFANSFECIDEDEELAKGFVQVPNAISIQQQQHNHI